METLPAASHPGAIYAACDVMVPPALESLLLGLHFRDGLTASDRRFLSELAPAPSRIILSFDGQQLFPSDEAESVTEEFTPSVLHQSDAIFTHRGRIGGSDAAPCVIHTVRVGAIRNQDDLGICQSDHPWAVGSRAAWNP
jgi:hypothetical protein